MLVMNKTFHPEYPHCQSESSSLLLPKLRIQSEIHLRISVQQCQQNRMGLLINISSCIHKLTIYIHVQIW